MLDERLTISNITYYDIMLKNDGCAKLIGLAESESLV